jgi:hypothetical protein
VACLVAFRCCFVLIWPTIQQLVTNACLCSALEHNRYYTLIGREVLDCYNPQIVHLPTCIFTPTSPRPLPEHSMPTRLKACFPLTFRAVRLHIGMAGTDTQQRWRVSDPDNFARKVSAMQPSTPAPNSFYCTLLRTRTFTSNLSNINARPRLWVMTKGAERVRS